MLIGIVVDDDDKIWGGEKGVGEYTIKRFKEAYDTTDINFKIIFAVTGKLPRTEDICKYDGLIFTGSHHSVNDASRPWIRRLKKFVQEAYQVSTEYGHPRMVGICFGHQLFANALGGTVAKNPDGQFNFGSVDVHVDEELLKSVLPSKTNFQKSQGGFINMLKFHTECVSEPPKIARHIGTSKECKYEILSYGNTILSMQGHPDYTKSAMAGLNSDIMRRISNFTDKEIADRVGAIVENDKNYCMTLTCDFLCQGNARLKVNSPMLTKRSPKILRKNQYAEAIKSPIN